MRTEGTAARTRNLPAPALALAARIRNNSTIHTPSRRCSDATRRDLPASARTCFPVTEARHAFTVACPRCDAELTVEFKKPANPPEAGQPPYDLLVKPGRCPARPRHPRAAKEEEGR